jgi:predicted aconitase with swiveling domain
MKTFKGRVLAEGTYKGEAAVSHQGFNTLASFQKSALSKHCKQVIVSDQDNKDLYKKNITGKAVCLPQTIGSTTGGLVIQTVCARGIAPAAFLFSKHIDSLAGAGIVLARVWNDSKIIAIDELGDDFLATVKTGDPIEIDLDGTVRVG